MMIMNRRDLCFGLSSFAAMAAALPAEGQAGTPTTGAPGQDEPLLSTQRVYPFDRLQVKKTANGETRPVLHGVLPTDESIEVHETSLLPGHMPHPPHKHRHSELMLIREGTLEFNNDGALEHVGPGGVMFAASNVMHGLKNVGDTNANYFVVAISHE